MRLMVVVALLALASRAEAHFFPGERSVVAQAEADGVAILVTYRPASTSVDLRAASPELRKALLAHRALATLGFALDGARIDGAGMQVKLVEERGKPVVVVLVTARVPAGAHTFTLDVAADAEPTSTRWLDRSDGRVVEHGPRAAGVPFQDRGRLVLTWR